MKKNFLVSASLVIAAFVIAGVPAISHAEILSRELQVGSSGSDVSAVQRFLAQDPTMYPQGLVTGYFGSLTKAAVANFQLRNEIEPVGRIGPVTLPVLNRAMAGGVTVITDMKAPIITSVGVNVSRNTATLNWGTDETARGSVYYSSSPLILSEGLNSVTVGANASVAMTDTNLHTTQSVTIQGLMANTTYYYMVYTTDQTGNVSIVWPSTFHTTN